MSLPDYTLPYVSENYTGPYLSNGQYQSSVAFGDVEPKSKLDALSRLHDTAYATYADYGHRTAADVIYNAEAKKLESLFPQLAGSIVLYGNKIKDSFANLAGSFVNPLDLIFGAVKNMYNLNDYMVNEEKYRRDILELYAKDPKKEKAVVKFGLSELFPDYRPSQSALPAQRPNKDVPVRSKGDHTALNGLGDRVEAYGLRFLKRKRKRRRGRRSV